MTRKQFLMSLGLGFVSLFGLSTLLGLFTKSTTSIEGASMPDYGMQNYGP